MASAAHQTESSPNLQRLTDATTLRAAWAHVRRASERSSSRAVRQEARRFEDDADRRLAQIAAELRAERFAFGASRGVAVARPGKRPRPLVIAPLEARVVARALLDVLQSTPAVAASFLAAPTSFGGLPGRGVEQAVSAALAAVSRGAVFYVRTDIADFFRSIPRDDALAALSAAIDDPVVRRLADLATRTELENLGALGDSRALFPVEATGVGQGNSLSTLLANALLSGFDEAMNGRGIVCLRYVDDLLILGPRSGHVRKAFASASRRLAALGLELYDPNADAGKAAAGHAAGGIEWLGCEIKDGQVRPGKRSRRALVAKVERILAESERTVGGASSAIAAVEEALAGFRGAYGFCATPEVLQTLDAQIGRRVERYFRANRPRLASPPARRSDVGATARHLDRDSA